MSVFRIYCVDKENVALRYNLNNFTNRIVIQHPMSDKNPEPILVEIMDRYPVYRKRGRFGEYYTWRGVNCAINGPCESILHDEVRQKLRGLHQSAQEKRDSGTSSKHTTHTCGRPRKLTPVLHLRQAKNGAPYALYFADNANEPTRLFFHGFPFGNPIHNPDNVVITWLETEYNIVS